MDYSGFHFAHNAWLWGLLAIPAIAIAYALFYRRTMPLSRLERFADPHLLPHLLTGSDTAEGTVWRSVLVWSLLWACGIIALAEPRWNYTDMQTFKPEQNLVVLLDLSKSMDAEDVKPSRLAQAREKIHDLLGMSHGMNIGLVAYAADAHMISPVTDDTKLIGDMLPYLDTSLPAVQGNNLKPALAMASRMLGAEPGNNKSILIISDGGFHDGDVAAMVNDTVGKDIAIYAIGVGTEQGAPIPVAGGGWIKGADGKMVISHLQAARLQTLSELRGGLYADANYTNSDLRAILDRIGRKDKAGQATGHTARVWQEHFYIPVMLMTLLILPWFRRGYVFPALACLLMFTLPNNDANAAEIQDVFLNQAQQAHASFNKGDYKSAAEKFDTPYRRGVAQYKAGDFAAAEKSFMQAETVMPEAQYNLGNAEVMQQKYEDAIASYESVLKRQPHNANAAHNLDIARKLLQLQKQQQQKQQSSQQQKDQKSSVSQQNSSSGAGGQQQKQEGRESASNKEGNGPNQSGQKQGEDQQSSSKDKQQASAQQQNQGATQGNNNSPSPQNAAQAKGEEAGKQPSASMPNAQAQQEQKAGQQGKEQNAGMQQKPGSVDSGSRDMAAQERPRTQKDVDADQWLRRIENDPQSFLKNQFLVETENSGTKQGAEPW